MVDANPDDEAATRTPGNRRAAALVGLVLDGAGAESNPRRREALFTVLIDHETFLSGTLHADTVLETLDGGVIPSASPSTGCATRAGSCWCRTRRARC